MFVTGKGGVAIVVTTSPATNLGCALNAAPDFRAPDRHHRYATGVSQVGRVEFASQIGRNAVDDCRAGTARCWCTGDDAQALA